MRDILGRYGAQEYGFRIQGLAAHVVFRQGALVRDVNSSGHPDIFALDDAGPLKFEIEADAGSLRDRQLTKSDIDGLAPQQKGERGYFGVLVINPRLRWSLVPWTTISRRRGPLQLAVLQAVEDSAISTRWTEEMIQMVCGNMEQLWMYSFRWLKHRALSGRPL